MGCSCGNPQWHPLSCQERSGTPNRCSYPTISDTPTFSVSLTSCQLFHPTSCAACICRQVSSKTITPALRSCVSHAQHAPRWAPLLGPQRPGPPTGSWMPGGWHHAGLSTPPVATRPRVACMGMGMGRGTHGQRQTRGRSKGSTEARVAGEGRGAHGLGTSHRKVCQVAEGHQQRRGCCRSMEFSVS
eukprot:1158087-Pelagomonas_calceolata.AAC.4